MTKQDERFFDQAYEHISELFQEAQETFDVDNGSGAISAVLAGTLGALSDWLCTREEIGRCANDVIDQIRAAVAEELGDRARAMDTQANSPAPHVLQ